MTRRAVDGVSRILADVCGVQARCERATSFEETINVKPGMTRGSVMVSTKRTSAGATLLAPLVLACMLGQTEERLSAFVALSPPRRSLGRRVSALGGRPGGFGFLQIRCLNR